MEVPGYVGPGTIDGAAQVLDTADYGWLLNARDVERIPSGRVSGHTHWSQLMSTSLTDVAAAVVLLTLAVVLTLSGLFTDRALPLIAGVGLVVIAALGAASTRVSIRAAGAEITIERQLPVVKPGSRRRRRSPY